MLISMGAIVLLTVVVFTLIFLLFRRVRLGQERSAELVHIETLFRDAETRMQAYFVETSGREDNALYKAFRGSLDSGFTLRRAYRAMEGLDEGGAEEEACYE